MSDVILVHIAIFGQNVDERINVSTVNLQKILNTNFVKYCRQCAYPNLEKRV